jgi:hypothetical protein
MVSYATGQSNVSMTNSAAATGGTPPTNQNSPALSLVGNYWNGSTSNPDTWTIQNQLQTGTTNPTSTLYISHSGSPGAAILQAPGFQSLGSGAGGIAWPAGATPSIPGVGLTASAISHYAPSAITTGYGISWPGAAATGLFYGTQGSSATFASPMIMSNQVQPVTVSSGGTGYFTPPSCYFTGGTFTQVATCHFNVNATTGAITSPVQIDNGGNYTVAPTAVNAAPTMSMAYLALSSPLSVNSPPTTLSCPTCLTATAPTSGQVMIGQGSQALAAYPGITASGSPSTAILAVSATSSPDVQITQVSSGDNMLTLKQTGAGTTNPALDIQNSSGSSLFTVTQTGTVITYNGSSTAGTGVTSVVATGQVLNHGTTSTGNQTLLTAGTLPSNALYRASYYIDQNTVCSSGSGTVGIVFAWTDQNHSRGSATSPTAALTTANALLNNTSGQVFMNVASSAVVTWNTAVAGTCSGGTYDVYATLERIQ